MKNIFIILASLIVLGTVMAADPQDREVVDQTIAYGENVSYVYKIGTDADTIGTGDSIWCYKVRVKSKFALKPEAFISFDKTGGTWDTVDIYLLSKTFAGDNYTMREHVEWESNADANIILKSDSAHISEFWQILVRGENSLLKAKIDTVVFKVTEVR